MMRLRTLPAMGLSALLAGCQAVPPAGVTVAPMSVLAPVMRPVGRVAPSATPSLESQSAVLFYARLEQRLLANGRMRRDDGDDAPFGAAELARNFERIALFSEYVLVGGRYVAQQSRAQLRRWPGPVRLQMHFGPSVPDAVRRDDEQRVAAYADRLRRLTGHPIGLVASGGNYHIFVASVDEQRGLAAQIAAAEPGLSRDTVSEITSLDRSTYCAVYASSTSARPDAYVSAVALVRSEHPDLMRLACYHEEIAQGLGLANDSPAARPSIFNDDEEFALLTRHDALLLQMLYDPRLAIGMSADEARPIIRQIAAELVGGST